jgi:acyl-CoA dehydrogenase
MNRHTREAVPEEIVERLERLDEFIDTQIKPIEQRDDNIRFFDHRREFARTDVDADGTPRAEWLDLLGEARKVADDAGWFRHALPVEAGGNGASNYEVAIIREHLASRGIGLHNDLQTEHSVVGQIPPVTLMSAFGTPAQKERYMEALASGRETLAFGLTEPDHGSDATYLETTARLEGDEWVINGRKRWNSLLHNPTDLIFARTSGKPGDTDGVTCFIVEMDNPGLNVDFYWWTFNMPTDHAEVTLTDARIPKDSVLGEIGRGMEVAQHFVHENRVRQASASLGAAQYCVDEAVKYANERLVWGKKLSLNQGIQFPLVELHTELAMLRHLIRYTAKQLDNDNHMAVTGLVAMCNYRANRAACRAADQAMQTCGGVGYSRHLPFEYIYRHHRRYRITEGAEEIQMRKVAQELFGFGRG